MIYLDDREVVDIEIDGINPGDYPDFCDAYISEAFFADSGLALDDEELERLTEENYEYIYDRAISNIRDEVDLKDLLGGS